MAKTDGPFKNEKVTERRSRRGLGRRHDEATRHFAAQHVLVLAHRAGDYLLVNTGNGVDEGHSNLPAPESSVVYCHEQKHGRGSLTDRSPGENILHASVVFASLCNCWVIFRK